MYFNTFYWKICIALYYVWFMGPLHGAHKSLTCVGILEFYILLCIQGSLEPAKNFGED